MESPHPRTDLTQAEAAAKEIIEIRRKLNELELGLESLPEEATEALDVLNQRQGELRERMATLQEVFNAPDVTIDVNVTDELARTDQSSLIPRV